MDLTTSAISDSLTPLAAFSTSSSTFSGSDQSPTWLSSSLNPRNRVDSLRLPSSPKWRIEGSANTGTEFFAIPTFLSPLRPLRIDTFIPPMEEIPRSLHDALDLHAAIYTRDARVSHLVTKKANFGAKISVVGFLLPYYPNGTLRDELRSRALHDTLRWEDQARWAVEIAQALIDLRNQEIIYCDLRMDNIVLNENNEIVLIDFESRGVSTFMSAPEVTYLEYILALSNDKRRILPSQVKLWEMVTQGIALPHKGEIYKNPRDGYHIPWLCLSKQEREAAQVYMLGRVLWCIFEGVGSPEKSFVVQHAGEEREEIEFPEFKSTPPVIRELIAECCDLTRGEYSRFPITLKGRNLCSREPPGTVSEVVVRDIVKRWWIVEVERAEEFLRCRVNCDPTKRSVYDCRPSMEELLKRLERL